MNERRVGILKKVLRRVLISVLIITATFGFLAAYTDNTVKNISDNIVRLHVVAESDIPEDQEIKLLVRDEVLEFMDDKLVNIGSEEEGAAIIKDNLVNIESVARDVVASVGKDYSVRAEYGNFPFPTKTYANVRLPAGQYNSLRITLGKGQGMNWWCVMFPPLCFVDSAEGELSEQSQSKLKEVLPEDEYNLITEPDEEEELEINVKFKIVEIVQGIKNAIKSVWDRGRFSVSPR